MLNSDDKLKTTLSASLEWQMLEFSNEPLPDEFKITLSDEGSGWGEWSAISLRIS